MTEESTHFGYQTLPTSAKTSKVAQVFHSVAQKYDLMNDCMSLGLHRLWKRYAISQLQVEPTHTVLDLACGSGDLSLLILKKLNQNGQLILSDINPSMLNLGRKRLINKGYVAEINLVQANAEKLSFPQNTFDRIIMGFGLRNVTYKSLTLSEIYRCLKPGGKVIILEFSKPQSPLLNRLYDAYSFNVLPLLGKVVAQDEKSYQYLAESIRMHPNQECLKEMLENAGFFDVSYHNIHDGIVALHKGFKFKDKN